MKRTRYLIVSISGAALSRPFNLTIGTWGSTIGSTGEIQLKKDSDGKTFSAMMIPQTIGSYTVKVIVTIDGVEKEYTFSGSNLEIDGSTSVTANFTLGLTEITSGSIGVKSWGEGGNFNGDIVLP